MPTKREFSAGGIVFKDVASKVLWLITKPAAGEHYSSDRWQFPKGLIEEGEGSKETALREVREEAGVEAEVIDKVDSITIFFFDENKNRVIKNITFYLMRWVSDTKEGPDEVEIEEVAFLPFEEAQERLTFKNEKGLLEKAYEMVKKGVQETLL